jgi:hypothetical protein
MHTKDFLAEELEKAGLPELAEKARRAEYHDFLSPHEFPSLVLDADLLMAARMGNKAAEELRARHHNGEFDASKEESDEWAASPEGQEAFALIKGGNP